MNEEPKAEMTEYEVLMEMTRIAVSLQENHQPLTPANILLKFNESCAYPEIDLEKLVLNTVEYVEAMPYEEHMSWLEEMTK